MYSLPVGGRTGRVFRPPSAKDGFEGPEAQHQTAEGSRRVEREAKRERVGRAERKPPSKAAQRTGGGSKDPPPDLFSEQSPQRPSLPYPPEGTFPPRIAPPADSDGIGRSPGSTLRSMPRAGFARHRGGKMLCDRIIEAPSRV